jgi:uncharacterized membrane protein YhaH (DUF805 family)
MIPAKPQSDAREKRIGPAMFFGIGVFLFALKFALDRTIARVVFARGWAITNYLIPNESYALPTLPPMERQFYLTMLAVALPFVAVGIAVTLRRLRDAGLPCWLVALFFVPIVNLLFFAVLSVVPSAGAKPRSGSEASARDRDVQPIIPLEYGVDAPPNTLLGRIIPASGGGAQAVAILLPAPFAVGATLLAANVMRDYGFGLFMGMPFAIAMVSALIYGYRTPRTLWQCISVGVLATLVGGALLILCAIDGLGCLLMLMPLALPIAVLGAAAGYAIQRRPTLRDGGSDRSVWSVTLALPALIFVEGLAPPPVRVLPVTTRIDIAATPQQVWHNVVTFDRIDAPLDWPFRAGVAYPVRARIDGSGVGAVRYCEFSTGPFVEPIETWDEPRLLKFSVTANPPPMREWSPFNIHPPHLENFLVSHGGEFRLTQLPGGGTRIEGTTWYENRMWPQAYWRWWSDYLIHRIHTRVLTHIKQISEAPGASARLE